MSSYITRTERSGSIFYRITGLIRSGQIKWKDRPIWYDVYASHPPYHEPIWNAKMPKHGEPVRPIFYPEDIERAKKFREKKVSKPSAELSDEV
uniref:Small ribosomal subunit protein mS23 n=1 Tax=Strongyloides stercoralis TaxID=6248 RepID=A0A0K0EHI2_STRER